MNREFELTSFALALAERVYAQHELLARRAERVTMTDNRLEPVPDLRLACTCSYQHLPHDGCDGRPQAERLEEAKTGRFDGTYPTTPGTAGTRVEAKGW